MGVQRLGPTEYRWITYYSWKLRYSGQNSWTTGRNWEIEYWIKKLIANVNTAVVDLVKDTPMGSKVLVVAIAFAHQQDEDNKGVLLSLIDMMRDTMRQLHTDLHDTLPGYMVPVLYFPVTQVPQTSLGKVDRLSIRKIIQNIPDKQIKQYALTFTSYIAPSTAIEKEPQSIWAALLHKDVHTIGVHENLTSSGQVMISSSHENGSNG